MLRSKVNNSIDPTLVSTEIKRAQRCYSRMRSRDFPHNFPFPADQWRRVYPATEFQDFRLFDDYKSVKLYIKWSLIMQHVMLYWCEIGLFRACCTSVEVLVLTRCVFSPPDGVLREAAARQGEGLLTAPHPSRDDAPLASPPPTPTAHFRPLRLPRLPRRTPTRPIPPRAGGRVWPRTRPRAARWPGAARRTGAAAGAGRNVGG